jgi:alginate O-acetyltransferase complex protein AlgJ
MSTNAKPVATAGLTDHMHKSAWLCAAVMLGLMTWGSYQTIHVLTNGKDKNIPWSLKDVLEGPTTDAINKALDKQTPGRELLITTANAVRYKLIHGAGDDVRLGSDGWLFLTEEIRYQPDSAQRRSMRVQHIAQVQQALQKRGIDMQVALVPDKARVYSHRLGSTAVGAQVTQRQADVAAQLKASGVKVIDLMPSLSAAAQASGQSQVYYNSDTHWNQIGAKISADVIAQSAGAGVLKPVTEFQTTAAAAADRPGDLLRLMGLDKAPAWLRPRADVEATETTQEIPGKSTATKPSMSLLGDASAADAPPVVLLGTSYSQRANFHGALQQALRAKVLNMSKDGGGLLQAAEDYFKDDAFKTNPPKLVIWEVPERMFDLPPAKDEAQWFKKLGL